jgi:hypothetical protein
MPFKPGRLYRARRGTQYPAGEEIVLGEILTYRGFDGYAPKDGCDIHRFVNEQGQVRSWWWDEREPPDSWREFFTEL